MATSTMATAHPGIKPTIFSSLHLKCIQAKSGFLSAFITIWKVDLITYSMHMAEAQLRINVAPTMCSYGQSSLTYVVVHIELSVCPQHRIALVRLSVQPILQTNN